MPKGIQFFVPAQSRHILLTYLVTRVGVQNTRYIFLVTFNIL